MFCSKCGNELRGNERFCGVCGTPNEGYVPQDAQQPAAGESAVPTGQPIAQTEGTPTSPPVSEASDSVASAGAAPAYVPPVKKGLGKGAVFGVAATMVLILAALAVVLAVSLGGTKAKVGKAAVKSFKAYASAVDSVGMPDLVKIYQSKKVSQSGSIELRSLTSIPGYGYGGLDSDALKGLGVRFSSGYDLSGRKMNFSGAAFYGSTDLITGEALVDNNTVSVYVPDLFDNTAYGVDTTTLGKDLDKLELYLPSGYEKIGFNVFDLLEQVKYELPKVDASATKAFIKAVEIKKVGTSSIDINGSSTKCTQYHVVIPKDAVKDYIDALKDAYKGCDYDKKIIEALRSTGIPKDELSYLEDEIKNSYSRSTEVFNELKDFAKEIGDVELDVYVNGGYLSAVIWEGKAYGSRGELGVYLGGGKNYVDDLSVELRSDGESFSVTSNGDHAAKSGTFTDSTTLRYRSSWEDETIKSELEYQPKKSSDNFSWRVKAAGETLKVSGQLTADKNKLDLQLDDVSLIDGSGNKQFSVRLGWSVGPYNAQKLSASKTELISTMSRSALEDLEGNIMRNAERWGERMYDKYENLFDVLQWLF